MPVIPEFIPKTGRFFPEWVAGLVRNQWQLFFGTGGRFVPESTFREMTKRKKYGKKGHGGEKSHEFLGGFIMRRPVTLLQKEDKRKAALSIIEDFIQSVKNEVTLALKAI